MPFFSQPGRKLGSALQKVVDAARRWRRAGHLAREMHDDVAVLDIGFQHGERIAAEVLKILLDLDLDVRPRQGAAQRVAIVAELVRHAGEKELNVRHSPPPALRPWHQCGMAGRGRQRAGRRAYGHPRVQANLGGFPLSCRENAAVLNLADACPLPNMAPMRFFYGLEAIYAGPGFV